MRVFHGDVAPEHDALVVRLEDVGDAREEVEIDLADADFIRPGLGLAAAELEGLVGADVQERAGVYLGELVEHLLDQRVRTFLSRGEHVPVRGFREVRVKLVLQNVVQVSKRLLLGHHGDVILRCVLDQLARLAGRDRGFLRRDQRLPLVGEHRLHVGREHVDLVLAESADLLLEKFELGDGTAAEVVVHAAPAHRGPVANGNFGHDQLFAVGLHELAERLHAVEESGIAGAGDHDAPTLYLDGVALVLEEWIVAGFWLKTCELNRTRSGGANRGLASASALDFFRQHFGGDAVRLGVLGGQRNSSGGGDRDLARSQFDLLGIRNELELLGMDGGGAEKGGENKNAFVFHKKLPAYAPANAGVKEAPSLTRVSDAHHGLT